MPKELKMTHTRHTRRENHMRINSAWVAIMATMPDGEMDKAWKQAQIAMLRELGKSVRQHGGK